MPVLLHLLGDRINAGRIRLPRSLRDQWQSRTGGPGPAATEESSGWYRVALKVMTRPVAVLAASSVVLLALAAPATQMRTFTPDARILPDSSQVRTGYDHIQNAFGIGTTSPLQVVITSRQPIDVLEQADALSGLDKRLGRLPHVDRTDSALPVLQAVSPQAPFAALAAPALDRLPDDARDTIRHYVAVDNRTVLVEVIPDTDASSDTARDLLNQVQNEVDKLPASFSGVVGGETAEGVDANRVLEEGLPKVILIMLATVYALLLLTFRSLLLPLKAIAMNLLSIAATYGVLVLVFQNGLGTGLLDFEQTDYLQNFVPVLLLALLFSLSTDYEVFLLDRVREEHATTGDNTVSVARGLTRTAPLISGAALLMVAVFGAFGFAGIVPVQQLGFGLAVAILLDATLVRILLVPATMRLMGRWNWWLPRPGARTSRPAGRDSR